MCEFYSLEPGLYLSITDFVETMNNLIQEGHNDSLAVSQLNCLEERKKLRFTLQMKYLVLHFLLRTWDTFSVAKLARSLE